MQGSLSELSRIMAAKTLKKSVSLTDSAVQTFLKGEKNQYTKRKTESYVFSAFGVGIFRGWEWKSTTERFVTGRFWPFTWKTWSLVGTKFLSSCSTRQLTCSLRSLVSYRVKHSSRNSTRTHVLFSIYYHYCYHDIFFGFPRYVASWWFVSMVSLNSPKQSHMFLVTDENFQGRISSFCCRAW